ncbi:MAG: hypothetical protein JJU12_01525 [Chlamydiales bacterium]|nr:hypothetical protein [Chlamydiales bacterium]
MSLSCDEAKAAFVLISNLSNNFSFLNDPKAKAQWVKESLPLEECREFSKELEVMRRIKKCLKENSNPQSCTGLIREFNQSICSDSVQSLVNKVSESLEPNFKIDCRKP